tara:strand:- start:563 stop:844 length:282 start_codon:yes stop_codon:yes gene_type:complete
MLPGIIIPAFFNALTGVMTAQSEEVDGLEPPPPRPEPKEFIEQQARPAADLMSVALQDDMPMIARSPQSELAALSMFDVNKDNKNPLHRGVFT